MNLKFLKFIVFALSFFAIPQAWAQKKISYSLIPIAEPRLIAGEGVVADYELPCGAELVGLVLRQPAFEELSVGVLVRQRAEVCVGIGRRATLTIPYFQASHVRRVRSIDPLEYQNKPRVIAAEAVRLIHERSGQTLDFSFASQCGRPAGVLLAPQGEHLGVGFVELDGGKSKDCKTEVYLTGLVGLRGLDATTMRSFQAQPTDLGEARYMRLAEIRPNSLKLVNGKLTLRYARRCNEAPVGLVHDFDPATGETSVGMLVARYFNQPCAENKARYFWTRHESTFAPSVSLADIQLRAATRNMWDLVVRRPHDVRLTQDDAGAHIALNYYGGCGEELGAVVVGDDATTVAGVLMRTTDAPCKSKLKEVSLSQRFATHSPISTAAMPLSLKGGETH